MATQKSALFNLAFACVGEKCKSCLHIENTKLLDIRIMAVLRVKEVMRIKGYSRERLAEEMGVTLTTITNINQEHTLPSVATLLKIAEVLDVDVRDLFEPTKGGVVTPSNVDEAKVLLNSAMKLLNGE